MIIPYSKIRYYWLFLYFKIRLFQDCQKGRLRLYLSECIHLLNTVFRLDWEMPKYDRIDTITTVWGKFRFIGDIYSYLIMNPSFERPDMEYFVSEIQLALKRRENVLFLDIGANVGLYSIGMPKHAGTGNITIHAFEPDPLYYKLLKENIIINRIKHIKVHFVALGDKNRTIKTRGRTLSGDRVKKTFVTFKIKTLDSLISRKELTTYDRIFVKIDIEGHEEESLRGAETFLRCGKPMLLMIEDCVNPSIQTYMQSHRFMFRGRITPYNSFWEIPVTNG